MFPARPFREKFPAKSVCKGAVRLFWAKLFSCENFRRKFPAKISGENFRRKF
jgi:hypothetical protein